MMAELKGYAVALRQMFQVLALAVPIDVPGAMRQLALASAAAAPARLRLVTSRSRLAPMLWLLAAAVVQSLSVCQWMLAG
jgi:hypothetical protein